MTSPVPDALRTQLAEVLAPLTGNEGGRMLPVPSWLVVDAVLPLLARARVEGAAEALREAAKDWRWSAWSDVPRVADRVAERIGTANYVGDWLSTRAAALSASTTTEGDPT